MYEQSNDSKAQIWPTALAGFLGALVLVAAVLVAGPADAGTAPAGLTAGHVLQR